MDSEFGSVGTECNVSGPCIEETSHVEPPSKKHKGNQGLRTNFVPLDEEVWLWYQNSTRNNLNLTKCDIQNYARTVYFKADMRNFKASDGWYRRWRHRWVENGDLIKTKAELQDTSSDLKKEIINFEFPDFDENLFSIGKPDRWLEALGNLKKEQSKKDYREPRPRKRRTPAKTTIAASKKKNSRTDVQYRPEFKERVASYTANHSFRESAEKFGIHPTTVSRWSKDKGSAPVQNVPESSDSCSAETDLADWLRQLRLSGRRVSKNDVQEEVTKIKERLNCSSSKWFSLYYSRLHNGSTSNIQYPQVVKTEVVKLASSWSQKYVSSILCISRKQIYNWSKEFLPEHAVTRKSGKLDDVGKNLWEWYVKKEFKPSKREILRQAAEISWKKGYSLKITEHWFRKWCTTYDVSSNSILDKELLEWILKKFDQNSTPSHECIRKKCAAMHKKIYGETSFKASKGWVVRFCERHSDLLQKTPAEKTILPQVCEEHKKKFKETLIKIILDNSIELHRIGIMDETALKFSIPTKKIKRSLRLCSFKNIEGSFVVSCTASGVILPLLLILKGTNSEPDVLDDIIITYEQSGTLNSEIMNFWVDRVWLNRSSSASILILDSFQPHKDSLVKEKFVRHKSALAHIPAGCGSHFVWILSDVCEFISEHVNQKWQYWLKNSANFCYDDSLQSGKSPSHSEIISWIRTAFTEAKTKFQTTVQSNFLKLITAESGRMN